MEEANGSRMKTIRELMTGSTSGIVAEVPHLPPAPLAEEQQKIVQSAAQRVGDLAQTIGKISFGTNLNEFLGALGMVTGNLIGGFVDPVNIDAACREFHQRLLANAKAVAMARKLQEKRAQDVK